jgi:hypothetical protein
LSNPIGAVTNSVSNALNNPAQTLTNIAVSQIPVVGALNTISGLVGGPTIGSALFGKDTTVAATSPEAPAQQVVSTTPDDYTKGTDGSAPPTENAAQQAAASATKNLTLNTAALSNLANFLSTQNSAVTPGGITPYVGVPAGSGIGAPVIPEFGGVSYPTGTASSGSSGSGTA